MNVVVFLSQSYSGSTVVSMLAGMQRQVETFGDCYVPARNLCTCGQPIASCPRRFAVEQHYARTRTVNRSTDFCWKAVPAVRPEERLARFLRAINETADDLKPVVFWDGSKLIDRARLWVAHFHVSIVHLVRDPDEFAHGAMYSGRQKPENAAWHWVNYNACAAELCAALEAKRPGDVYRFTYQEFVDDTSAVMAAIGAMIGGFCTIQPTVNGLHMPVSSATVQWQGDVYDHSPSWAGKPPGDRQVFRAALDAYAKEYRLKELYPDLFAMTELH